MTESTFTPEVLEQLFDRLSKASERISSDIEQQAKQFDRRVKSFVDQGERATQRLVETIDKELRAQITALRKEIEQLARRIAEIASQVPGATAPVSSGQEHYVHDSSSQRASEGNGRQEGHGQEGPREEGVCQARRVM